MSKRAIRLSEAEAANNFRSPLARVRAGVDVVIERDAEGLVVVSPGAPQSVCCLSRFAREGTRLERDARRRLRRNLEAVVDSLREPRIPSLRTETRFDRRKSAARRGNNLQRFPACD
jgi:hypothetical protein